MNMIDLIKQTAIKAVEATNPVNMLFGTVSNANPLEIEIHQKLKLPKEFLTMTELAASRNVSTGDKVVLIRMQGGNQFLVIDRVVE
jgi:hypothetical protein